MTKQMTMLQSQIIGCGAAGGKVVSQCIDDKVLSSSYCMIINSTDQDKPDTDCEFVNIGQVEDLGGCAKEPSKGRELCIKALQNGLAEKLNNFIKADTKKMYIITSLEGGTGCGSSMVVAQFVKQVLGLPVHIIAITGFEDDPRGLKNTIQFFQQIDGEYTVSILSNKKFLKESNKDKLKAEQLCNKEISRMISILNGQCIIPSNKNIDQKDLLKLNTKTGYMSVNFKYMDDKIRNIEQFNEQLKDMIDNNKSMDLNDPKQTTLGVIINVPEDEQANIDYSYKTITDHYNTGESVCYEVFTHVQYDEQAENFIAFVNAGMQLPLEEVQRLYDNYSILKEKAEKEAREKKNAFFAGMQNMIFDDEDSNDLQESKSTMSANDFISSLTGGVKSNNIVNNNNNLDNF